MRHPLKFKGKHYKVLAFHVVTEEHVSQYKWLVSFKNKQSGIDKAHWERLGVVWNPAAQVSHWEVFWSFKKRQFGIMVPHSERLVVGRNPVAQVPHV